MNDDEGRAIVQQFADSDLPTIPKLDKELMDLIRPNTLDMDIVSLLAETTMLIHKPFDNELTTYGFNPKEAKINLAEPTLFSRILKNASSALNMPGVPDSYKCDKFSGIVNPYFSDPSLLVSPKMLSGRSGSELSFAIAKALMLLRPEFYLLPKGQGAIELIILMVFKFFRPNLNIPLDKTQQVLKNILENNIRNDEAAFNRLSSTVNALAKRGGNLNTLLFVESVEDFCNRIGLLFCDNIAVVEKMLNEEAKSISSRSVRDRIGSLLVWAMSEDYIKLRQKLGLCIKLH